DAEGQREGDQEDRDRGRDIAARDAEAPSARRGRAVRGMSALGGLRASGMGGDTGGDGSRLLGVSNRGRRDVPAGTGAGRTAERNELLASTMGKRIAIQSKDKT